MYDTSRSEKNSLKETQKAGKKPEVKDYEMRMWSGVRRIYVCLRCSVQKDDEDSMKLHVLEHFPEDKQEEKLDELVKEGSDE